MSEGKRRRREQRAEQRARGEADRAKLMEALKMREGHETKNITPGRDERGSDHLPFRNRFWKWIKEKSSFTDWCLVIFTGALAVASFYQFILLGGQLNVMQNDERAWVAVDAQHVVQAGEIGGLPIAAGQPVTLPLRFRNIGKTPGSNIRAKAFLGIFSASEEVPLYQVENDAYSSNNIVSGIIFPNSDLREFAMRTGNNGAELATSDEIDDLKKSRSYWAVYGIVTYVDVFHRRHWTRFCIWNGESGNYQTRSCTEYNSIGDY